MSEIENHTGFKLPPLVMLRAFEAAARLRSMRRASSEIGVSHTVISRHVRSLEMWLGQKLVLTSPHGLELTKEGEVMLAAASRAFTLISRATIQLRPQRTGRQLSVWCTPGLASAWLTRKLSDLEIAMQGVAVDIHATGTRPDLNGSETRIWIGFNLLDQLPPGAISLTRPRMFPVASPRWLESNGMPSGLAELARMPLLHELNELQWVTWFEKAGVQISGPLRGPRLSDASICFEAAMSGQGVALVNNEMAKDELHAGHVVKLFNTDVEIGAYYLQTTPAKSNDPIVLDFKYWMIGELRSA